MVWLYLLMRTHETSTATLIWDEANAEDDRADKREETGVLMTSQATPDTCSAFGLGDDRSPYS